MDGNMWQQILHIIEEARRASPHDGVDSPVAVVAALAAKAAAAAAAAAAAPQEGGLRPLKKPRTGSPDAATDAQHSPDAHSAGEGSAGHDAPHSSSADGSEWQHYGGLGGSSHGLQHEDQATPTTLHGLVGLVHGDGSPALSHNQQQQLQHGQQQHVQDGQGTPTTTMKPPAPPSASASPAFSNCTLGGLHAVLQGLDEANMSAAAAAGHTDAAATASNIAAMLARPAAAAAAGGGGGVAEELQHGQIAQDDSGEEDDELSTQERLLQVTMLDKLFDLTCTRFSIKDGVVAPRKFFPRLQHGSPMPIQLLLQVHDSTWDPNEYTSTALNQLGQAVRENRAAAAAAAEGNPAGYAAVWAQYLSVRNREQQVLEAQGMADGSVMFGPYPSVLVPGLNAFGGLLRIRNIKHNGELKQTQNTPHVLVLREKVGADAVKLHVKLTNDSVSGLTKTSRLVNGATSAARIAEKQHWAHLKGDRLNIRAPSPSAAIAAAAAAATAAAAEAATAPAPGAWHMPAPALPCADMHSHRGSPADTAAELDSGRGDNSAPAPADLDEALAHALLDLRHVR